MKATTIIAIFVLSVFVSRASAMSSTTKKPSRCGKKPKACPSAKYQLTMINYMSKSRYRFLPDNGLVFSPIVSASHNGKISVLTFRGYASDAVKLVAEKGDNSQVVASLTNNSLVKTVATAKGPTIVQNKTSLTLEVDCENSFVTALSMVAPSPDWIVALPNYQTYKNGRFTRWAWGKLRVYDAGTDKGPSSGSVFTPPMDTSLDVPQVPPYNIHPISESAEDPGFRRTTVGYWTLWRVA